jgi:hypothetical protein
MLQLANDQLRIDVLDPTADADLLGPRFCAGAFVWQVHDASAGPLLSGPEGPEPKPDPFNGHGLPEACRDRARSGETWLWEADEGFAPGVGTLGRGPDGVIVTQACTWHLDIDSTQAKFRSRHAAAGYDAEVGRTLELHGRTLRSHSRLTNTGQKAMELEWFAHPFFALGENGDIAVELPATASVAPESGFVMEANTLRGARRYIGKDDGAFTLPDGMVEQPLDVRISHPALENGIRFTTDFHPSECPIWMNGFTFSIEPYQRLSLAPGESREWQLTYKF